MKFKKKPVEVEAVQFTGDNWWELETFTGGKFCDLGNFASDPLVAEIYDEIHHTWVGVRVGDWIIRGVNGEFYPIDPGVLAETYEVVA